MRTDKRLASSQNDLQQLLDKRGYIVIANWGPHPVGKVLDSITRHSDMPDQVPGPMVVLAETDERDFVAQAQLMGWNTEIHPGYEYFYRVGAE